MIYCFFSHIGIIFFFFILFLQLYECKILSIILHCIPLLFLIFSLNDFELIFLLNSEKHLLHLYRLLLYHLYLYFYWLYKKLLIRIRTAFSNKSTNSYDFHYCIYIWTSIIVEHINIWLYSLIRVCISSKNRKIIIV